jgi:hypothetical protein
MGNVIVTEFVSIDGVMEAPGGEEGYRHTGWTFEFPDEGQYEYKDEELREAEVQLLGRVTYEGFAAAWPEREDDPDPAGFAKRMNAMPKYVVSTTLEEATWQNTTILRGIDEAAGPEGRAGRQHPRRRQPDPGPLAARARPGRRAPPDDLPRCARLRRRAFPDDMADKRVFELFDHRQYGSIVVHAYRRAGR